MSCQIQAVQHRKSAAGLAGAHLGLQGRILLNYTRIENARKVRKKTSVFLLFVEVQQNFGFPFSLLRHYQTECFQQWLFLSSCNSSINHATEIGNAANAFSACADQP